MIFLFLDTTYISDDFVLHAGRRMEAEEKKNAAQPAVDTNPPTQQKRARRSRVARGLVPESGRGLGAAASQASACCITGYEIPSLPVLREPIRFQAV